MRSSAVESTSHAIWLTALVSSPRFTTSFHKHGQLPRPTSIEAQGATGDGHRPNAHSTSSKCSTTTSGPTAAPEASGSRLPVETLQLTDLLIFKGFSFLAWTEMRPDLV